MFLLISESKNLGTTRLGKMCYMVLLLRYSIFFGENKAKTGNDQRIRDFPGGAVVENLPANAGDVGSSPGPGRSHMLRSN